MKRLLRGVISIGDSISGEHLALNYKKLCKGLSEGLAWDRPEDATLFERVRKHFNEHDESPSIEILWQSIGDDIELRERLKDIAAAQPFVRSNYTSLVDQHTEKHLGIRVSAALKEAHEIVKKKGYQEALSFLDAKIPAIQSLTAKAPKTLPHVNVSAIFEPLPPIPWLCEGLRLAPGGVAMFAGYGYSGKTIAAQHIALCIAAGLPVFGVHPVRSGRVLHLDYEQGSRLTFERYQRLAAAMNVSRADLADRLCVSIMPDSYLDTSAAAEVLAATVEGFSLVIIDSFKASCPNTEENASSVRIPLDLLARLSEKTGVVPLVIDHARKPKEDAAGGAKMSIRGSSAKFDALTTSFVFSGDKGMPTRIQHEKCRHRGSTLPDFGFRVVDIEVHGNPRGGLALEHLDEAALEGNKSESKAAAEKAQIKIVRSKIVTYLGTTPEGFTGSRSDLRKACDGGQNQVFGHALRELEHEKRVIVTGTKEKTFVLVPEGVNRLFNGAAANDEVMDLYKQV